MIINDDYNADYDHDECEDDYDYDDGGWDGCSVNRLMDVASSTPAPSPLPRGCGLHCMVRNWRAD